MLRTNLVSSTLVSAALAAAVLTMAQPAGAQTVYARDYAYAPPPAYRPVVPAQPYYAPPAAGGVVVYARPANCGVYFYWDGAECVDARVIPPPLDRERPIR